MKRPDGIRTLADYSDADLIELAETICEAGMTRNPDLVLILAAVCRDRGLVGPDTFSGIEDRLLQFTARCPV